MGKKRKGDEVTQRNEDPPEHKTEKESKKTRSANYSKQSTETLLEKEQEATKQLLDLQTELSHMRAASSVTLGNNELRAMNTKRYRAEYVLGEIKAEIERRARKRMGQAMPAQGIPGGSTAGVAATTTSNQAHEKVRQVNKACTSVLAQSLREQAGGGKYPHQMQQMVPEGAGVLKEDPPDPFSVTVAGGRAIKTTRPEPVPQEAFQPVSVASQSSQSEPQAPQMGMMPQMGMNFDAGNPMNAMSMMPTPEEMAQASMQFQQMQQMFMASQAGRMPQMPQMNPMQQMPTMPTMPNMPTGMPNSAPTASSASNNIPAAFRKRG